MHELVFTPSDFVAVLNQTMEFAYPVVTIEGELANVRVSRGKWVYFDIKDDTASVKCFGTVHMLPGPMEPGMLVRVVASPRMHPLYNFSLNIQSVTPVGEGSIKRASDLLFQMLSKEGLFEKSRKRNIPYTPATIGLITSKESAAYADFIKILDERWCGVKIQLYDVQVQGEPAVGNIVQAISVMNQLPEPPEVLVITRGGGSADDLAAFGAEQVVRAIAGSRIPTVVAIGHEVDTSLSELAADLYASTPSNAAELLVPDKKQTLQQLNTEKLHLATTVKNHIKTQLDYFRGVTLEMGRRLEYVFGGVEQDIARQADLLEALNPELALRRGYAVIKSGVSIVKSVKLLKPGQEITFQMQDGTADATINKVN